MSAYHNYVPDQDDTPSPKDEKELEQPYQKPAWKKRVKFNPKISDGMPFKVPEAAYYDFRYTGGQIFDKPEYMYRGASYEIWGTNYAPGAEKDFVYPNERCLAILVIADGIAGDGNVHRFPTGKKEIKGIWIKRGATVFLNDSNHGNNSGTCYFEFRKSKS